MGESESERGMRQLYGLNICIGRRVEAVISLTQMSTDIGVSLLATLNLCFGPDFPYWYVLILLSVNIN